MQVFQVLCTTDVKSLYRKSTQIQANREEDAIAFRGAKM